MHTADTDWLQAHAADTDWLHVNAIDKCTLLTPVKFFLKLISLQVESISTFTVGREQEISWVRPLQPSYLVYLLLYFQALQIIKLWFMTLECAVHVIFPTITGKLRIILK